MKLGWYLYFHNFDIQNLVTIWNLFKEKACQQNMHVFTHILNIYEESRQEYKDTRIISSSVEAVMCVKVYPPKI